MSMFSGPEEHAANGPETWQIVRQRANMWQLTTGEGTVLQTFQRRYEAREAKDSDQSWWRRQWRTEADWYAGEHVPGWRNWADVLAGYLAKHPRCRYCTRYGRACGRDHRRVNADGYPAATYQGASA